MNFRVLTSVVVYASGAATLISMYVFSKQPEIILLALAVLGVFMLSMLRNVRYLLWYVIAFVVGPIILDLPGLHFGLWSYGTPEIFGFPFWLPFFYGNVTVSFLYFVLTTQTGNAPESANKPRQE